MPPVGDQICTRDKGVAGAHLRKPSQRVNNFWSSFFITNGSFSSNQIVLPEVRWLNKSIPCIIFDTTAVSLNPPNTPPYIHLIFIRVFIGVEMRIATAILISTPMKMARFSEIHTYNISNESSEHSYYDGLCHVLFHKFYWKYLRFMQRMCLKVIIWRYLCGK